MNKKIDVLTFNDPHILNILDDETYRISIAHDSKHACALLKSKKMDLILVDLQLCNDAMAYMQSIKEYISQYIPILVISEYKNQEIYKQCLDNGAMDFLLKPFFEEELKQKVFFLVDYSKKNRELQESNQLLEQYKNTVDISYIVSKSNPQGNITYVNDKFCEISGYTSEELLGKPHNIIRHPSMDNMAFQDMWHTIKHLKKPWFGKIKNKAKDGSAYFVNTVVNPILDAKGDILEYIAIRNDITDIEKTKEFFKSQYAITSDKFDEVLSLSKLYKYAMEKSNIIIRVNLNREITYVNDLFCQISGYSKEEIIGKRYSYIKHPDADEKELKKLWNVIENGDMWSGTLKNISKNGEAFYSIATVVPIKNKDGKILEYMGIRQDITQIINLHKELEDTQREIIYKMGEIGETRSKETGNHVKRVAEYSNLLALKAGLCEEEADVLKKASPMHDIGKVGIPDSILNKPGKLTPEEFEIMKTHSQIGYEMLAKSNRPILKASAIVAYEHHEKYNGTGYPRGLKGEEIHLYGRITAICDVFDALGSDRHYKKAWSLERILELFHEQRGEHFDPKLTDLFLDNLDEFLEIKNQFI